MCNGHLPSHMAWIAYKLQSWLGLRYGLGTMTNNLEATETIFDKADYETMQIPGVACTVKRELRKLHTTFSRFGLFHPPAEQLICRINMLLQHYHTSTALSKKLDASFQYLQLQLDTPHNPLTLPFKKWGYLTPLSWVKMLCQSLDKFKIQLHMKYPTIPSPRERDQVNHLSWKLFLKEYSQWQRFRVSIGVEECCSAYSYQFWSQLMGGISQILSLTQGRSKGGQTIASHENVPHKKIGKHGSTSGTASRSRGTNWKYHSAIG
jgi:hypothetical protein